MFTKHKLLVWILFDIWGSLTLVYDSNFKYEYESSNISKKELLLKSILSINICLLSTNFLLEFYLIFVEALY